MSGSQIRNYLRNNGYSEILKIKGIVPSKGDIAVSFGHIYNYDNQQWYSKVYSMPISSSKTIIGASNIYGADSSHYGYFREN